jgi:hypothetical protein
MDKSLSSIKKGGTNSKTKIGKVKRAFNLSKPKISPK